jgi:hypothetical protein
MPDRKRRITGVITHRRWSRGCARVEIAVHAASASAFRARGNPFTRRVRAPALSFHSGSETVRENSKIFFFLLIWSFHPSGKPIWPFRLRRSLFDVVQLRPHKLHPCRNGHLGLRTVSVPGSRSPRPEVEDPCPLDPPTACSGIPPAPRESLLAGTIRCDVAGMVRSAGL